MTTNPERVGPIVELNKLLPNPYDVDPIAESECMAERLFLRKPYVPTIGCEIEVNASTVIPNLFSEYFGEQDELYRFKRHMSDLSDNQRKAFEAAYNTQNEKIIPDYVRTKTAGIPMGNDAFWEFAHDPVYSYKTLATEVSQLFDMQLIPVGYPHSLHVTLGNVEHTGGGTCIVISGLELVTGGALRIRQGMQASRGRGNVMWARKGKEGLLARKPSSIKLNQPYAVEFRTLQAESKEQATQTLRVAQMLGATLLGFRAYKQDDESIEAAALAKYWFDFRGTLKELWRENKLPNKSWGTPRLHKDIWGTWADVIDQSREDTGSHAYESRIAIEQIVDKTESLVAELSNKVAI